MTLSVEAMGAIGKLRGQCTTDSMRLFVQTLEHAADLGLVDLQLEGEQVNARITPKGHELSALLDAIRRQAGGAEGRPTSAPTATNTKG